MLGRGQALALARVEGLSGARCRLGRRRKPQVEAQARETGPRNDGHSARVEDAFRNASTPASIPVPDPIRDVAMSVLAAFEKAQQIAIEVLQGKPIAELVLPGADLSVRFLARMAVARVDEKCHFPSALG